MLTQIQFHRYNPFRRPDWRLERVLRMVDRLDDKPGRTTRRDDCYVKALRNFILRYRGASDDRSKEILATENPGLYFAFQIHEKRTDDEGRRKSTMIEARILAHQDDKAIAADMHTLPEVIEWYEALFFNVRDRLDSHDWVVDHVLIPALSVATEKNMTQEEQNAKTSLATMPLHRMADPFFDPTIKFFAYFGGHFVLDYVISGFRRGNLAYSRDELSNWFDGHTTQRLRQRSSVAASVFKIDESNVMQLFNIHVKLIEIERSNDTAENKQDQQHRIMGALISEIPWAVGKAGADLVKGSAIEKYDNSAAELRDSEVQHLSVGENPDTIDGVELLTMPKPRAKEKLNAANT